MIHHGTLARGTYSFKDENEMETNLDVLIQHLVGLVDLASMHLLRLHATKVGPSACESVGLDYLV